MGTIHKKKNSRNQMKRREFLQTTAKMGGLGLAMMPVLNTHLAGLAFAATDAVDLGGNQNPLSMTPEEMKTAGMDVYANYRRFRAVQPMTDWKEVRILTGAIPEDIRGTFLIASPNPCRFIDEDPENPQVNADRGPYHWFDGDGMIQALDINESGCRFIARQVETDKLTFEADNPDFPRDGIATGFGAAFDPRDPNTGASRMMMMGDIAPVDTANTMLSNHGDKLFSGWYFGPGKPYSLELGSALATTGKHEFPLAAEADDETRRLAPYTSKHMAAHTKVCAETGELICYTNFQSVLPVHPSPEFAEIGIKSNAIYVSIINPNGELKKSIEVDLPGARHIHDIAVTKNYILVFNTPSRPPFGSYEDGQGGGDKTQIGVLKRDGSESIIWFDVSSSYILHTGNAYEDPTNGKIVLTATRVENTVNSGQFSEYDIPQIAHTVFKAHFFQWVLDIKNRKSELAEGKVDGTKAVQEEFLLDPSLPDADRTMTEFPVVPTAMIGKKNRFTYMQRLKASKTVGLDALIKFDHDSNATMLRTFNEIFGASEGENYYGSEAQFVPSLNWNEVENEDSGWLLMFGTRERDYGPIDKRVQTELWIIDARNLEPKARILCGDRFPKGFHSLWIGSDAPNER